MPKHPLYETFEALSEEKPKKLDAFKPIPEKYLLPNPPTSTEYKKIGCLVLAGGQGTRLGFNGPKGCVELPLKSKKSLFQLIFEKIKAKGKDLPLALMTSPLNHEDTVSYLQKQHYFGLTNVEIFQQDLVPICNDEGELIYKEGGEVAKAPGGNGKALMHLYHSGIWEKWKKQGVEVVQVIPVDNPLAEPFDPELLGAHQNFRVDLVLKVIKRKDSTEKLGVIGVVEEKIKIREYSELTPKMRSLSFSYGNTGLFSCTLDFIERISSLELPWHLAHKLTKINNAQEKIWIWKFEAFIFDVFPYANSFRVIVGDRKTCFAPLKNLSGKDSLETVTHALLGKELNQG